MKTKNCLKILQIDSMLQLSEKKLSEGKFYILSYEGFVTCDQSCFIVENIFLFEICYFDFA